MAKRVLLIENDEALGHWLEAVLAEAQVETEWDRDGEQASSRIARGLSDFDVVVVEGVLGGQGVELCLAARSQGKRTLLLIPRGASVMSGVADRILEHPLTRVGFEDTMRALFGDAEPPRPPSARAEPTAPVEEDRMRRVATDRLRLGRAALAEGHFDAAIIELDAAAVLLPDDPNPRLLATWARYCRRRAAVREAASLRASLVALAEANPSAESAFYAASMAHDFGDVDLALQLAQRALRHDEEHVGARQLLEILTHGPAVRA